MEGMTSISKMIEDVDLNIQLTSHLIESYSDDPEWTKDHKQNSMEQIDRLLDYRLQLMATFS